MYKVVKTFAIYGDYIFAGTVDSGIYLSTNNGDFWFSRNNGITNNKINTIAINNGTIFTGTEGGVFFSTDFGISWKQNNSGLNCSSIRCFAFDGHNTFVGTDCGVFLSTDGGSNWEQKSYGLPKSEITSLVIYKGNIFAGTQLGVYFSSNYGNSWKEFNEGLPNTYIYNLHLKDKYLFAASHSNGIFRCDLSNILLSVENSNLNFSIEVYPNPVENFIKVKINFNNHSPLELKLLNTLGELLGGFILNEPKDLLINTSEYASGVYYITIIAGNETITKPFAILK